jgi:catechol 2,3-dioxygenase-like lactoylglutathione lyase family enzyme
VRPIEEALVELGRHVLYREVDLAPAVVARLEAGPPAKAPRPAAPRRMVVLVAATLSVLVGGLALFSPAVRAAVIRTFFLPGIRILVGQPEPPAPIQRLGQGLELGEAVSLSGAQAEVDFPIRLPRELGRPDRVFLEEFVAGGRVWLVYRAGPDLPEAEETGVGLLVTEFRGGIDQEFLKKVQAEGGSFQPVQVDGNQGYWIEGAHTLFFLDEDGNIIEDRTRVAGNVLVWEEDGVTYRIESALDLGGTLDLAHSFG